MKLKDFTISERPRERMLSFGPSALSNGELLAILLRTGTSKMNVLDVSRGLLNGCDGSLVKLSQLNIEQLSSYHGVKEDKAATLMAAIELGRRFVIEKQENPDKAITCAQDAYALLIPSMKGLDHEQAWVILLNRANKVLSTQALGIGCNDTVAIGTKEIVKLAIEKGASAMILAHNHPSGTASPSNADIMITKQLHDSCKMCGLVLVDHIIVCDDKYYSFADEKVSMR